jgi:hypothetical protein
MVYAGLLVAVLLQMQYVTNGAIIILNCSESCDEVLDYQSYNTDHNYKVNIKKSDEDAAKALKGSGKEVTLASKKNAYIIKKPGNAVFCAGVIHLIGKCTKKMTVTYKYSFPTGREEIVNQDVHNALATPMTVTHEDPAQVTSILIQLEPAAGCSDAQLSGVSMEPCYTPI